MSFWTCAFDTVLSQHTPNHMKKLAKMVRSISDEIDLDKELEFFSVGVLYVWEYLVSLPLSGKWSESVSKF